MKIITMNIVLLLFILMSGCKETSKPNQKQNIQASQKKISVSLMLEDSFVSVTNAFQIRIANGDWSNNVKIVNNDILLPELKQDTGYSITFTYKNIDMTFKSISKKRLLGDQEMKWKFGIDSIPFSKALSLVPANELKSDSATKKIQYLIFDPQETGIGVGIVNKIQ